MWLLSLLLAVCLLTGCAGPLFTGWSDVPWARGYPGRQWDPADDRRAVQIQASVELHCPHRDLHLARAENDESRHVWLAEGCGGRALYVGLDWEETWPIRLDGHSPVHASVRRYVNLYGDTEASLAEMLEARAWRRTDPEGPPSKTPAQLRGEIAQWEELLAQAVRDLSCPATQVVIGLQTRGQHARENATAQGCGRRVVYLPDGKFFDRNGYVAPYRFRAWYVEDVVAE